MIKNSVTIKNKLLNNTTNHLKEMTSDFACMFLANFLSLKRFQTKKEQYIIYSKRSIALMEKLNAVLNRKLLSTDRIKSTSLIIASAI